MSGKNQFRHHSIPIQAFLASEDKTLAERVEPILRSHGIVTVAQKKVPPNNPLDHIAVPGLLGRVIPAAVLRRQTLSSTLYVAEEIPAAAMKKPNRTNGISWTRGTRLGAR
jgi:hypothetical protein